MKTGTYDPQEVEKIIKGNKEGNGIEAVLVGSQGCGKTNGLVQIALERKEKTNDVIVWRGTEDCQWSYLLNYDAKLKFWLKSGLNYNLIDRKKEKKTDIHKFVDDLEYWNDPRELVKKLDNNYINIIQTTPHSTNLEITLNFCKEWKILFEEFSKRIWKRGITLLFDELRDLAKPGRSGEFWKLMISLGSALRKGRKNGISYFFSAHDIADVFWDVRNKIRWKIYMRGSKQEGDSSVWGKLHNLKDGEGIVEAEEFEPFRFFYNGDEKLLRARISPSPSYGIFKGE